MSDEPQQTPVYLPGHPDPTSGVLIEVYVTFCDAPKRFARFQITAPSLHDDALSVLAAQVQFYLYHIGTEEQRISSLVNPISL